MQDLCLTPEMAGSICKNGKTLQILNLNHWLINKRLNCTVSNSNIQEIIKCCQGSTVISLYFNFLRLYFPYTLISLYFDFPTLISLDYNFSIHSWHSYKQKCGRHNLKYQILHWPIILLHIEHSKMCHENLPSGFFKVWTFFRCFDRDLRELKQKNKFDTDQLFYYILNIQKMCY